MCFDTKARFDTLGFGLGYFTFAERMHGVDRSVREMRESHGGRRRGYIRAEDVAQDFGPHQQPASHRSFFDFIPTTVTL